MERGGLKMKISVSDQGDYSVGIPATGFEIEIKDFDIKDESFNYKDNRELFRKMIREIGEFLGLERSWGKEESINVQFEDEA